MKGYIELHWQKDPLLIRVDAISCVTPSDKKGFTEVYLKGMGSPFNVNESYELIRLMIKEEISAQPVSGHEV